MIAVRRYIITMKKGDPISGAFHTGAGEAMWKRRRSAETEMKKLIPPSRVDQFHVVSVIIVLEEPEE